MSSLDIRYIENLRYNESHISTLQKLGEYKGKQSLFFQQTPEVLKALQQTAIIESSESSNRLEGITAPHKRVEAIVLQTTKPKNRSEQEIAGYRDVLALVHESGKDMPFSLNVILQSHSMLYRYMPNQGGRWKMTDNDIVEKDKEGNITRIRFKPVSAVQTPHAMGDLINNYKQAIEVYEIEPLVLIPLTILDFLCIHPFTDGNGRSARLLTLLLLYHFDYQVGRFISLERIFEESKETYYESLEASSTSWHKSKHDVFPWLNYFWGAMLRAYNEFEERVGLIKFGKGAKTEQIRHAIERTAGLFSISEIESECPGISRDWIRIILRQLRDEKVIQSVGKGRGAKWIKVQ